MAKGKSNTSRTLEYYRKQGWNCCIAERWIINPVHPAGGYRKDLFGFGDLVALGDGSIIAIQSCGQDFAAHDKKLMEDQDVAPNMKEWLECNGRVILIGWRKVKKKKGGKATVWAPRIKEYTADDFSDKAEKPRVRVKQEAMIERWGDLYR